MTVTARKTTNAVVQVLREISDTAGTLHDEVPCMTPAEFNALADLEATISDSWWKMGRAFAQIKTDKLFRQREDGTKRTWEEYCKEVHKMTKQQVDKIIRAAAVRRTLETETKVSVLPDSVSQAAELTGMKPEDMATATENAVETATSEDRKPTAKDFRRAAKPFRIGRKSKPKAKPISRPPVKRTEYEVEVRISTKLSVPENMTAENVAEAIRFAERWTIGLNVAFDYEMSDTSVVVGQVRPGSSLDQFQPASIPGSEAVAE